MKATSTYSLGEPLVSHSPLPDSEKVWLTRVVTWPSSFSELLIIYGPDGSCGKTCRESCRLTEDGILVPSSGDWGNSGMGSPTESWTLNISEYPNDAVESSLSDILETGAVPRQFFLSPKACAGILRRADSRGKILPKILRQALETTAATVPLPVLNHEDL